MELNLTRIRDLSHLNSKPRIIHIQILVTLSLTTRSTKSNNNSLAVQLTSGAFPAAGATLNAPLLFLTVAIWRSD